MKELEDQVRVQAATISTLQADKRELEQIGVVFKPCPPVPVAPTLSKDSLVMALQAQIAAMNNTIEFYADGSFKANGAIESANRTRSQDQRIIASQAAVIDSLKVVKAKEVVRTITNTVEVDRHVRRGWPWWLWMAIGVAAAWLFDRRQTILSFIKNKLWTKL